MFSYRLLDDHAGLLLFGDLSTLILLREVVNDVADRSPILQGAESFRADAFRALAHDAKVACEGRLYMESSPDEVRYGAEMSWPVLLPQARILRVSLGYIDHGKQHQAIAYALEYVIEAALKEDFGTEAQEIIDQWQHMDDESILDRLEELAERFEACDAQQRKDCLMELLLPSWVTDCRNSPPA